jgi:CRP/FNR family transcriptional regulator, nitrogen fixation regulation protein
MLTQTVIRSEALRFVPDSRTIPATTGAPARPAFDEVSQAGSLDQTMQLMGAVMSYPRNAEIFGEDEPAEYIYRVVSGAVRTYKILDDGRRQIGAFYLPGDIFGLEDGDKHTLSAEAMTGAKVLVVKRSAMNALAGRDASIAQELFALTSRQLRRMQQRILLLAKTAQERVASFLVEMIERSPTDNAVELPMSRQDIADYLGLTIETVSRTLTHLQCAGVIELPTARRIVLRNRLALSQMNG